MKKLSKEKTIRICDFTDCTNKHDSHGYCANHARQYRKYGHPLSKAEKSEQRAKIARGNKNNLGKTWKLKPEIAKARKGIRRNTGRTHFKKGMTPWNKGLSELFEGDKNPNWKDGAYTKNYRARRTQKYKQWRTSVFERDDYTCQHCRIRGAYLEADHIKPFAFYPELRFELTNGRTLCKECHMKTPTYKKHKIIKEIG